MVLKSGMIAWPQVSFQFLPFNLPASFHRESFFFVVCGASSCITDGCSTPQCEHDLERLLDPATSIERAPEEVDKVCASGLIHAEFQDVLAVEWCNLSTSPH